VASSIEYFCFILLNYVKITLMNSYLRHLFAGFILFSLFTPLNTYGITLNQAIEKAMENLPQYRSKVYLRESQFYEYRATLSPYLPQLDLSASQKRIYVEPEDYDLRNLELRLSYLLFDGGKRYSQHLTSKTLLKIADEEIRQSLLELQYNVKVAFYNSLAKREILEHRKTQLKYAEKNFEVAKGRHELGVARLSDVLQASVRLEEARSRVIDAEGELKKSLAELNSLIGINIKGEELEGELSEVVNIPEKILLLENAMNSPEVKKIEFQKELNLSERILARSDFLPSIYLDATYTRNSSSDARLYPEEEKSIGLRLTFNIFELRKFFRLKATSSSLKAKEEDIREVKRIVELKISKAYEDLITELKRLEVAKEQLRFAEQNYEQAFGEYKVGKGDILSLIQSESLLADAKEKLTISKLNIWTAIINLERVSGGEVTVGDK
jgi:outer membrane protein